VGDGANVLIESGRATADLGSRGVILVSALASATE